MRHQRRESRQGRGAEVAVYPARLLSARQSTAQALCISPELPVRHREARAWPGIPAPAWAASIQPVT
jgi:hypothetical protein